MVSGKAEPVAAVRGSERSSMSMSVPCQQCGFANEPAASFCVNCGAFLVVAVVHSTGSDRAMESLSSEGSSPARHVVEFDRSDVAIRAGESALFNVLLRNSGTGVEQYSVSIVGVPTDWVSLETSFVSLLPGAEQRFTIAIRPGDGAVSVDHHPTVTVTDSGGATASYRLSVRVGPDSAATPQADDRGSGFDINRMQYREPGPRHASDSATAALNDQYIFVSYSRTDQMYVDDLCSRLRHRGVAVWVDSEIDYGTRWQTVVKDRLDACAAVLVVMSPAAEESRWVGREVDRAEARGKAIFPLLLDGTPFFGLSDLQHEDVTGGRPPSDRFFDRLRAACQP